MTALASSACQALVTTYETTLTQKPPNLNLGFLTGAANPMNYMAPEVT